MVNGSGEVGHHAPKHVEMEHEHVLQPLVMDLSMLECHAVVVEQRQKAVKAGLYSSKLGTLKNVVLAVEGSWTAWSSWNTCSSTCGTGTQSRTRSYTGGLPCTGSSSDTQNCQSKIFYIIMLGAMYI